MKVIKHTDASIGGFGYGDVAYEPVGYEVYDDPKTGKKVKGSPIFIVPDHVAGDLLKFPHWSIPDQELDANGHSALVALQKKEDAERKKAEAEAQKSPQQEADAQTAPKGKRSAKQLKVVLAEGASELAAQSIEGQNSGETPESVEARETEERRETLAQVVGSPEQIAEEEASEETEVVETAKAKKKRVRRTKKK